MIDERFTAEQVFAFLLGEAPMDGLWFDDEPLDMRGNYWWRKHLRKSAMMMREREVGGAVTEGMCLVTNEDGNNYCRILSLLGMEEEGDAVVAVERLIAASRAAVPDEFVEDIQRAERLAAKSNKLNRERMMGLAVIKHLGHLLAALPEVPK